MCKRLFLLLTYFVVLGLIVPNITFGGIIEVRIADDLDDAEEDINPSKLGEIDEGSSDLELAYEDEGMGDPQFVGVRYQVDIPKGAAITDAWIRFQVDEDKGGSLPVNVIIEGELSPNASQFVGGNPGTFDISTRPRTAAQVQWSIPNWTTVGDQGPDQTTPNIASIIQEIVNQDGWASGNALVLIISDDPANPSEGIRVAEAGPGDDSALLHVEFTSDGNTRKPSPADGVSIVDTWVTLTWTPGDSAVSHNVYFSNNLDDVSAGSEAAFQGNQVETFFLVGLPGFPYPEGLVQGTTYYWRIDEIDAGGFVEPGDIWEFEVPEEIPPQIPRPIEPDEQLIRNYTPPAWQAEDVPWGRDVDPRNKVDDIIDRSDANTFDVVVNYKRAVQDGDIDFLSSVGAQSEVQMRLRYLSSVAVGGLTKDDVLAIAADLDVAFIEQQVGFAPTLDVSVPGICVTPAAGGCAATVPAGTDGSGVNIVIMDSGVDNAVHDAFSAGQYVAGYDAITGTFTDPDDDSGHGTHVASIALGQATTNTSRGVAPGAGLIDVRVFDAATTCSTAGIWITVTDGLQTAYDNRNTWGVDVINMSFGQCNAFGSVMSEGLDAFSQLVDLAESMGIVVVATAGNNGPNNNGLASPGAATRAITVAACNHMNTVTRADDGMARFSSRGLRHNDGDADDIDELKPEVTAPGNNIPLDDGTFDNDAVDADTFTDTQTTAPVAAAVGVTINVTSSADIAAGELIGLFDQFWPNNLREQVTVATSAGAGGTSFTTTTTGAHPIGVLVWELEPRGIFAAQHDTTNQGILMPGTSMAAPHVAGLAALIMEARPGINAASVKDLIISTAVLPVGAPASRPAIDATWNDQWGWGLVNASVAINLATQTDLTFPHHPASPGWLSKDISHTKPLKVGQTATVTVAIRNNGPNPANNVRVHFGVHVYSAATPTFYDIGTEIVNIPVNATGQTTVSKQWVPLAASHQCLKVEIGYSPDTDYSNNCAQRNVSVATSPVQFYVKNTLTEEPAKIDLIGTLEDPNTGWTYRIDPPSVIIAADDGPVEIEAELYPPADAKPGAQQILHIAAVTNTTSGTGKVELGGISFEHTVQHTESGCFVLDDFESYSNTVGNRITETWIDGRSSIRPIPGPPRPGGGNGSRIWLAQDKYHGGAQSMAFSYMNEFGSNRSEIYRILEGTRDWTRPDISVLSMWFHGDPKNDPEPMYVAAADRMGTFGVLEHNNPNAAKNNDWTEWRIDLQAFANQGLNILDVDRIIIGFGTKGGITRPGGSGMVYFDDIQLCPPKMSP